MKKMMCLLAVILLTGSLVLIPASALAQVDEIGFYAEPGASSHAFFNTPNVPFPVYVVLTNPSSLLVWGFEFGYEVTTGEPDALFRLQNALPPQAVDLGDNTEWAQGDYVVGLATPLIAAEAIVLVTWQFMATGYEVAYLNLGPSDIPSLPFDLPAYEAGGTIVPMTLAPTCWGTEVRFNEHCPLPVEEQVFGAVKALYR